MHMGFLTTAGSNGMTAILCHVTGLPEVTTYNLSDCLYICQTITFERHDVESSYLHIPYNSRQYGSGS